MSSTTVLSCSCLEVEDHEQDKTVVELMILYLKART
jgi:hypothetical protein